MHQGPTTTSSASSAPDSTMAVGWISATRAPRSLVEDHGAVACLGDEHSVDAGAPLDLPDGSASTHLLHMDVTLIAREHRLANAGVIHRSPFDQLAFGGGAGGPAPPNRPRPPPPLNPPNPA